LKAISDQKIENLKKEEKSYNYELEPEPVLKNQKTLKPLGEATKTSALPSYSDMKPLIIISSKKFRQMMEVFFNRDTVIK